MEVSGELQTPVPLSPLKETQVRVG